MLDDRHPALAGHSMTARALRHAVGRLAPRWTPVLVDGPPGAGQLDVARALHRLGKRAEKPFARFDAMAWPAGRCEALIAEAARQAGDGTLCIEAAERLPAPAQARVEALAIEGAVGDGTHVRARIIVGGQGARLLPQLAEALRDRIPLPPLAERPEDVGFIAAAMLGRIGATAGIRARLALDALPLLTAVPDLPRLAELLTKAAPHAERGEIPARVIRRLIG